jgi:protein SCO1/2
MLNLSGVPSAGFSAAPGGATTNAQTFLATGVVMAVNLEDQKVVIRHDAISNYMAAMTMPFNVKDVSGLAGLQRGAQISFRLHVAATESWVDQIIQTGNLRLPPEEKPAPVQRPELNVPRPTHPLLDYPFTNEMGQAVRLTDFPGQALAITFFYTRCPLPDFCPRLSKNFQEASQKLKAMTNAPVNWHFLSISFDTEFDTPAMLKNYGEAYQYDPAHWSFLTGPPDKIAELARGCGASYTFGGGTFDHNFRTLIVDAAGHLQMVFPMGGNLSDAIVEQIVKAAAATNQSGSANQNQ